MSEIKWIKLSTSIFDDEKIKLIEAMPNSDTILLIWIKLLILAGKCNKDGYLMLNDKIHYTEDMLVTLLRANVTLHVTLHETLHIFSEYEMIDYEGEIIHITNWGKHQNIEGLDKIRFQTKERVRKLREKNKAEYGCIEDVNTYKEKTNGDHIINDNILNDNNNNTECNVTCNVTVTDCNVTVTEQNKNKNKNKNKENKTNKADVIFPDCLNNSEFIEVWNLWEKHRKEKKQSLTPTAIKQQLKKLADWGLERSIKAIEYSIAQGWQGIYEQNNGANNGNGNGKYYAGGYKKPLRERCRESDKKYGTFTGEGLNTIGSEPFL